MVPKTQKQKLETLRKAFKYDAEGRPDVYSFGIFKRGLTSEEIETYLRVRAGKMRVEALKKKFNKIAGCNTCALVTVAGERADNAKSAGKVPVNVVLHYRHDVERYADVLFEGKPTYFD